MRTILTMRGAVIALVAACAWACSDSNEGGPDAGAPPDAGQVADAGASDAGEVDAGVVRPGGGNVGKPCEEDSDCGEGVCLQSTHLCSLACTERGECPGSAEWTCLFSGSAGTCSCQPAEGGEQCNGKDDDCDGIVDDGAEASCPAGYSCSLGRCHCPESQLCGDTCVDRKTNPEHCGACGHACGAGEACVDGSCTCAGKICGGRCVDTRSERASCGDCGTPCRVSQDCVESSCVAADREWARWVVRNNNSFSTSGANVLDQASLLTWQRTLTDDAFDRVSAEAFCDALVTEDGVEDWRLPTRIELLSIVDFSQRAPAADPLAFPDTPAAFFWTSSTNAADPLKGWAVSFNDGYAGSYPLTAQFRVRCVRQE